MEIADRPAEENPPNGGQHRIAQIAMQGRHGARRNAALEAIAHHQIITIAQSGDEGIKRAEIIGIIAIAHDDITTACARNARNQRRAIAFFGHINHPRTKPARNGLAAIGTAIIRDQHLARNTTPRQVPKCLLDAGCQGFSLIKAGH